MLAMERLPLSQTSQFPHCYPLGSPTVQSPRAGMPAGHFLPGLPSPPALHHTGSKHISTTAARLGSPHATSSMQAAGYFPPYDTTGLFSHPALLYSPTVGIPSPMIPPSSQDRHSPSSAEGGVLASLVAGQATSTVGAGSSSENSTVDAASPRESSSSAQGMCGWLLEQLIVGRIVLGPCRNVHSTLIVV